MEPRIRKAAIKFYKKLHRKVESKNIIDVLNKKGYDVIFYNTQEGDEKVKAYNLQHIASTKDAFTYHDSVGMVFVNHKLSATEKRNALLHEAGHICLGHIGNGIAHLLDTRTTEAEAEVFRLEVLHPSRSSAPAVSVLLAGICLTMCASLYARTHKAETAPASAVSYQAPEQQQQVCITPTGTKYHTENCIHTNNKNYAKITKEQAEIIFSPCSICNP